MKSEQPSLHGTIRGQHIRERAEADNETRISPPVSKDSE